jgi:hypothetical protein
MRLRIATWNVNSVRLRAEQVARFVDEQAPTSLPAGDQVPGGRVPARGLRRHGPAAPEDHRRPEGLARGGHRLAPAARGRAPLNACREGHARCVSAKVAGVEIHNFYIPAGGDIPDRALNPKFDHKLDFYETLTAEMSAARSQGAADPDRRPERGPRRERRLEPPPHVEGRQPHAGRARGDGRPDEEPGLHRPAREAIPSRKSCSRGGATAPPTSASPTAACAWTTSWPAPACATRPSTARSRPWVREWSRPTCGSRRRASTTATFSAVSANGNAPATTRRCTAEVAANDLPAGAQFLSKPYSPSELVQIIADVTDSMT